MTVVHEISNSKCVKGNEKANCLVCGWPRCVEGLYKQDGLQLAVGEFCQGSKLYNSDGLLVKIVCVDHCSQCHQPVGACACCQHCHFYHHSGESCAHGPKKSPPSNEVFYDTLEDPVSPPAATVPIQWKCGGCKHHIKACTCTGGPTNAYGEKFPLPLPATQSMPVPWIQRGQMPVLKHTHVDDAWKNLRPLECDPVEWAADFYLYQAITSGGLNTQHVCDAAPGPCPHRIRQLFQLEQPPALWEAQIAMDEVIEVADRTFVEYIDMACGGELRHHPSVGPNPNKHEGILSGNRSLAWAQWRDIRDHVGVRALLDMAELFLDYQDGETGIAGKRWADAALLLHRRLTGGIPKMAFVDQTFSLVHNGGVFLNKREWKNNRLYALQGVLLPAQARDDFDTILDYASPLARSLWSDAWRAANYARIRAGVKPSPFQRKRGIQVCGECGFPSFAGHNLWKCRNAKITRLRETKGVENFRRRIWTPNFSWDLKTVKFYSHREYFCNLLPEWGYTENINGLLESVVSMPEGKRSLSVSNWDSNFLQLGISKFKGQDWKLRDLIELHGLTIELVEQKEEVDA